MHALLACSSVARSIRGQSAVITGGSRGLGVSIARAFAREGVGSVLLVARSAAALEQTRADLSADYPAVTIKSMVADVTSAEDRSRIVEAAADCTLLVNNAGVERWGPYESITAASIEEQLHTNLLAPMQLTRAFIPRMLERRGGGAIVNVASLAGKLGS